MSEDLIKHIFSNNLKFYMLTLNKSQSDIMRDLKVPSATISSWVNGKRLPRMSKLQELADYFKVTKTDLLETVPSARFESKEAALNYQMGIDKNPHIVFDKIPIEESHISTSEKPFSPTANIGENIKQLRNEKKMTTKNLSELTGISEKVINQYESGARSPQNKNLRKLAYILDPSGSRLLGEELPFDLVGSDEPDSFTSPIKTLYANLDLYENKLLNNYRLLNESGKKEANKRIEELTEINKYTKK